MTSHYSRCNALIFARLITAIPILAARSGRKTRSSAPSSAKAKPISPVPTGMSEGKDSGKVDDVFLHKVIHSKGITKIKKVPTKVVILSTGQLNVALTLGIAPVDSTKGDGVITVPEYLKKAFPKQADKLGAIKDVDSRKSPNVEDIGNLSPDLILVNQAGKDDIDILYKSLSEVAPAAVTQGKSKAWKRDFLLMTDTLDKPETVEKRMEAYQVDAAKADPAIDGNPTASLLHKINDKLRLPGAASLAGSVPSDIGAVRLSTQTPTDDGNKDISSKILAEAKADWVLYGAQRTPRGEKDKGENNTGLTTIPLRAGLKAASNKHTMHVDSDAFLPDTGPTAARLVMITVTDVLPKKK